MGGSMVAGRDMARPTQARKQLSKTLKDLRDKKSTGGRVGYAHGGQSHKSVQDMERACNKMVGMNTMDIKGDK